MNQNDEKEVRDKSKSKLDVLEPHHSLLEQFNLVH